MIGFAGFVDYPHLAATSSRPGRSRLVHRCTSWGSISGLPSPAARALWLGVGLALVGWVVLLGRRGDERTAFIVAVAAALALTPIIWLHYFALLLVVVAIAQPRLGLVWFVPFAMFITPGSGDPTPFDTAWTLGVAAVTIGLAVRASRAGVRPVGSDPVRTVVAEPA